MYEINYVCKSIYNNTMTKKEIIAEMRRLSPLPEFQPKTHDYTELYNKVINKLGYNDAKLTYLDKGKNGVVYSMNFGGYNYTVKFTGDKSDANLCNKIKSKNLKYFTKIFNVNLLQGQGFETPTYVIVKEYVSKLTPQEYKDFSNGYLEFLIHHGVTNISKVNNDDESFITSSNESKVPEYVINWYLGITREMQANGFFTKDIAAYNIGKNSKGEYVVFDMGMSLGGQRLTNKQSLEINEMDGSAVTDMVNTNVDKFQFDESQHVSIPAGEKNLYYDNEKNEYFKDVITRLGYDYSKVHLIGSGSNGIAFKLDNIVIKFTSSKSDAETSYKLVKNHSFDDFVCKIYGVYKIQTEKYKVGEIYGPYIIVKEYIPPLNDSFQISFSRLRKMEGLHYLYDSKVYYSEKTFESYYKKFITEANREKIKPKVINWYLKLVDVMAKNRIFIEDINYTNVGSRTNSSFAIFDIGDSTGGSQLNKSHNLNIK